ncbi:hypothetical protein [Clostridium botulinum]
MVKGINNNYKYDIESMLHIFANKFLSGKDLDIEKIQLIVETIE